jgi:hypothetical protein
MIDPGQAKALLNIGGATAALLAVVATGAALAERTPDNVWITAACYGAPAALAFAGYCWIAHRPRAPRIGRA